MQSNLQTLRRTPTEDQKSGRAIVSSGVPIRREVAEKRFIVWPEPRFPLLDRAEIERKIKGSMSAQT